MRDLIREYSISEILLIIISVIVATKGAIMAYDWFKQRGFKFFQKEYIKPKKLEQSINELVSTVKSLNLKVDVLMQSDKDAIKAFVVQQHHYFCCQIGEIDYQSLQSIEKRYDHYKRQGGNSYVDDLMQDLRALPKTDVLTLKIKSQAKE